MAASLIVIKSFPYRGSGEEWSNRYHFDGGAPEDETKWLALDVAVRAAEKLILLNNCTIVRSIGYAEDDTPAVFERTASTVGTINPIADHLAPGDCCTWIRYTTARRDARGHPVYLRNYYHNAYYEGANADLPTASLLTAMGTYASSWVAGFSDGTVTHKRTGPDSLGATGHSVSPWISRRKLKRRG